ncbi:MAG: glycosyltransferase family 39 protein [Verrucomicrobiaceae bacterium]|nr:glycosyltransferase family 39 protein [Verrucomicrobiaceae bacterium]
MKQLFTHLQDSADPARRRLAWRFVIGLGSIALGLVVFLFLAGESWMHDGAKLAAKGLKPRIESTGKLLFVRAAVVNLGLLIALLLTSRWWIGPAIQQETSSPKVRWGWILLIALAIATAARLPRMTLGFYNDEAHNYARLYGGLWEFAPEKAPLPKFDEPRWGETFWLNNVGNNSQPFSVAARLSLAASQKLGLASQGEIVEWAARLPALVAGLLTIVLLTILAARTGGNVAAWGTSLALALHGWHIRYSTEARGYSLMILGVAVIFLFLHSALQTGRWRDWLGFGGGVFLCLWAFMGAAYFIAVFCGLVMLRQVVLWKKGAHGIDQVIRPTLAGLLAAMLCVQMLLPLIPQLLEMLQRNDSIHGNMNWLWWRDILGFLTTGVRWLDAVPNNPINLSVARWLGAHPWQWVGMVALIGMIVTGTVLMIRRGSALRLIGIGSPLAITFAWGMMARKGLFLHYWYIVYALPWVVLAFGAALAKTAKQGRCWIAVLVGIVSLWPCGTFAVHLAHTGRQDERAAVMAVRGAPFPHYAGADAKKEPSTLFAAFWTNATLYDPFAYKLEAVADLEALMKEARSQKRDLYVCYAHEVLARSNSPELLDRVIKSPDFEHVGTFYGQEEAQFTEQLYRLKPEAAIPPRAP